MGKWVKYRILIILLAGSTYGLYAQLGQNNPPPPTAFEHGTGNGRGPCGELPDNSNGKGPGIPPPVGLCLPINDYLFPLLLVGIGLGSFMIWKLDGHTRTT